MWTKIKHVPRRTFRPREMTETGKDRERERPRPGRTETGKDRDREIETGKPGLYSVSVHV